MPTDFAKLMLRKLMGYPAEQLLLGASSTTVPDTGCQDFVIMATGLVRAHRAGTSTSMYASTTLMETGLVLSRELVTELTLADAYRVDR